MPWNKASTLYLNLNAISRRLHQNILQHSKKIAKMEPEELLGMDEPWQTIWHVQISQPLMPPYSTWQHRRRNFLFNYGNQKSLYFGASSKKRSVEHVVRAVCFKVWKYNFWAVDYPANERRWKEFVNIACYNAWSIPTLFYTIMSGNDAGALISL